MAKQVNRISNNGKLENRKTLLATLAPNELASIREAQLLTEHVKRQYKLMYEGLQSTWRKLGEKYNLPKEFDFDTESGKILRKGR